MGFVLPAFKNLGRARETRGMTLRDIAATTKISMTALVAIERNDFARPPATPRGPDGRGA